VARLCPTTPGVSVWEVDLAYPRGVVGIFPCFKMVGHYWVAAGTNRVRIRSMAFTEYYGSDHHAYTVEYIDGDIRVLGRARVIVRFIVYAYGSSWI